jgi:hypothetical protein
MRGCLPNSAGSSTGAEPKHDSKLVRAIGRWSLTALMGAVEDRPNASGYRHVFGYEMDNHCKRKISG